MALRIIEGVPGSGKTYYAVNHLFKTYFEKEDGIIVQKKKSLIVSNIDNLELGHQSLDDWINWHSNKENFFSYDTQAHLMSEYGPFVYVIDEAQLIFDRKFYDRGVFEWFEKHRHLGQDIYLITQNANKLPKDITCLVEYIIRAQPRSRGLTGHEFIYKHLADKDILKREVLKVNKEIFSLYKSMSADETEKPKNPFIRRFALYLGISGFVVWFMFHSIFSKWTRPAEAQEEINQQKSKPAQVENMSVTPGQKDDGVTEVHLSYILQDDQIRILWKNEIYFSMTEFPYKIYSRGKSLYAKIPDSELPAD